MLLTPRDYPWLKPGECFVVSDVSFEHLEAADNWRQFSSTAELIRGLRNRSLDFGADERLAIHARIVQPLLDVTLLFLGLPLVLSRSKRNVFLAIGHVPGAGGRVYAGRVWLPISGFELLGSSRRWPPGCR